VQFALNVTELPLTLPLSFCLPKECMDTAYFQPTMDKLTAMTNEMLALLKTKINFDNLYNMVEDSRIDTRLIRQLTAIVSNQTEVTLSPQIPT